MGECGEGDGRALLERSVERGGSRRRSRDDCSSALLLLGEEGYVGEGPQEASLPPGRHDMVCCREKERERKWRGRGREEEE